MDIAGKIIKNGSARPIKAISITDLPAGMYLLEYKDNRLRFIKQ
jgi:hypothetical protein